MNKFQLEIITPDRVFFRGTVDELILTTSMGEIEVMYHTLPMVSVVSAGLLHFSQNGKKMEAVCSDGFICVRGTVSIFVHDCKWPYEIDVEDADSEIARLNAKIKRAKSLHEYRTAKTQLAMQLANLKIKNTHL